MTAVSIVAHSCQYCGTTDAKKSRGGGGGCPRVHFHDCKCQRPSWHWHRDACPPTEPTRELCPPIEIDGTPHAAATARVPTRAVPCITAQKQSPAKPQPKKQPKKQPEKQLKTRSNSVHVLSSAAAAAATSVAAATTSPPRPCGLRKTRSVSLGTAKRVAWGDVWAREFARFPGGGGAVPYDGTWALGLGRRLADVPLGSVSERERARTQTLQARAEHLTGVRRRDVREGETRQFDYRRGVANPLFARLEEDARKWLLTHSKDVDAEPYAAAAAAAEGEAKSASVTRRASPTMNGRRAARRKASAACGAAGERRDGGDHEAAMETPDFGCVSIEQLDEFTRIRDSREGACGCSCGDLVKKVAKMNVKKLRAFLSDRQVELPGRGKTELMAAAKALARAHKNCQSADADCECARNGVPCHADVCEGCAGACCNPLECYTYKSAEVKEYRKEQLAKYQQLQGQVEQ